MTKNQIEYQKLKETQRSNRVGEKETGRHNLEVENQGQQQIDESKRHNRATEGVDLSRLAETERSNKAVESLRSRELAEISTHNRRTEGIDISKLQEQQRSNLANESLKREQNIETNRANIVREQQQWASINEQQVQNFRNYTIAVDELAEKVRSNQSNEMLKRQANYVQSVANAIRKTYNDAALDIQSEKVQAEIRQNDDRLQLMLDELILARDRADWDHALGVINSITGGLKAYGSIKY